MLVGGWRFVNTICLRRLLKVGQNSKIKVSKLVGKNYSLPTFFTWILRSIVSRVRVVYFLGQTTQLNFQKDLLPRIGFHPPTLMIANYNAIRTSNRTMKSKTSLDSSIGSASGGPRFKSWQGTIFHKIRMNNVKFHSSFMHLKA